MSPVHDSPSPIRGSTSYGRSDRWRPQSSCGGCVREVVSGRTRVPRRSVGGAVPYGPALCALTVPPIELDETPNAPPCSRCLTVRAGVPVGRPGGQQRGHRACTTDTGCWGRA